ncbi:hypothetical protein MUCCIDRAFT_156186 [Mucor lusitanicus CBS 277.49]|uniref:Uncharacterized protein n=1 Tax=Mucor lusitanicus CBS 277.49 TaxID=747725 RepID=A0A168LIX5_MUCCL|nr:hypothetical protein MUCCIDRAFT_156186 [Mucor lusitanicus CBS 277.49]
MGKIVTATGDLLDAAIQQAEKMTVRGQEIQRIGRDLAIENMEKLDENPKLERVVLVGGYR